MKRVGPQSLLVALLLFVPLVVAAATAVAFLLLRAGYGLLVGALVPYGVSLLLIVTVSVILGRAASGQREAGRRDGAGREEDRRPDDV